MRSARLFRIGSVLAACPLLLLAACGGTTNSGSASSGATAVTVQISGPVTSLDPAKGSSTQDAVAALALYSPLVTLNQQGKLIADLATSWSSTPTSVTLHIRKGVTCSDGKPLTPSAVAGSLQRFVAPSTAAPLVALLIGAGNTATVTSDDAQDTVTVSLAHPYSQLLSGLSLPFTGIVCPGGLKDPSTLATHSDGTGPFVSNSEVSGSSYTFGRRSGYDWGPVYSPQPPGTSPKTLILKVVEDENTSANLMSSGSLDIGTYSSTVWTRFKGKHGYSYQTSLPIDAMLAFNEAAGHPTASPAIRAAIAQAVNRTQMNNVLGSGYGALIANLGQPAYQCYDSALGNLISAFKPSAAKKVLHGVHLRVIGTTGLTGGNGTSYLEAALNQAGASATLQNSDNEAWNTAIFSGKGDWDVTIFALENVTNSILGVAAGFFTGNAPPKGENIGDVQNPRAASSYTAAVQHTGAPMCAALSGFQRALMQRTDVVPLAAVPTTLVFANGASAVVEKGIAIPSSIRVG